jgi:hypothetical protein
MYEAREKKEYEIRRGSLKQKQQKRLRGPVMFQTHLDSLKYAIRFQTRA